MNQVTTPDGTIYKTYYHSSNWDNGLPQLVETWSNTVKQRWASTTWTQDSTAVGYPINPRPSETNIYDANNNRKRATFGYYTYNLPSSGGSCSLLTDIYEYAANAVTLYRYTHKSYDINSVFTTRGFIGMLHQVDVYDGSNTLSARNTYWYDYGGECMSPTVPAPNPDTPVQHDNTNYTTSFLLGRGNLALVVRYDVVNDPTNLNNTAQQITFGYNSTGSLTLTHDNYAHQKSFYYTDSYSDSINRNTYAYPTTLQDEDGYQSFMQYNYNLGVVTRAQTPSPNAGQTAPFQTYTYDTIGRLQQVTDGITNGHTRWVYQPDSITVQSFTTIRDTATEAYSVNIVNGAGKLWLTAADHPGSAGGYKGRTFLYDNMGRVVQAANQTEITANWFPAGDDPAGWIYTNQAYDWKGRPTVTTLPDGYQRVNTYTGCGCAGGDVVTVKDEAGRQRVLTKDVLGRLSQVQEFNSNGTVYATTTYAYNVRDQLTSINQAGQVRSFDYDGQGRLWHLTTPEQGQTTYTYNYDDTLNVVTDARGATTTYGYNGRHLVTGLTYGVPAGVAATSNVTFGYDAAGNRTSMTDGLGSVNYGYDQLSRLTSETRTFTGLGSYTLSYGYNVGGELTSVTNPWNAQVGYVYDSTGRVNSVTGAGYAGITSYVNSIAYRAFDAPKQVTYGNTRVLALAYDNRLRMAQWNIAGVLGYAYNYDYFGEHTDRVTFANNLTNGAAADHTLDRSYYYDSVGRLMNAYSGSEARATIGTDTWGHPDGPYAQVNNYDVWGNLTQRQGWGGVNPSYITSYTNNRLNGFVFDASGNLTDAGGGWTFSYDATGQQASSGMYNIQQSYDGDRLRVKKTENGVATYYLRSSVLGGLVIAEISGSGIWNRGYVHLGSQLLAVQQNGVYWIHQEPYTKGKRVTDSTGAVVSTVELDPWGEETARDNNDAFQPRKFTTYERDVNGDDEAMNRKYNRWWSRYEQADPYHGSYDLTNPQSFNRYAYVNNDPINFVDPSGLVQQEDDGVDPTKRMGGGLFGGLGGFIGFNLGSTVEGGYTNWLIWNLFVGWGFGGGNQDPQHTGPEKAQMLNAQKFHDCVQTIYGVEAINIDTFAEGPMSFTGKYGNRDIYLEADLSHDSRWLGLISGNRGPVDSTTVDTAYFFQRAAPKIYIANERVGEQGPWLQSKFVYELGNALHMITKKGEMPKSPGRYFEGNPSPRDVGGQLEDCVYNGKVEESGYISHP